MEKEELELVLSEHEKWLADNATGKRVSLRYANLSYADLRCANLSCADLSCANLRYADLRSADLRSADLRSADLRYANLSYADLRSADLRYANLRYADLRYANLSSANLSSANLSCANLRSPEGVEQWATSIVPQVGSFEFFKKAKLQDGEYKSEAIVRLACTHDAKRSNAPGGRKIRVSSAVVVGIVDTTGAPTRESTIISSGRDPSFVYKVGELASVGNFDDDYRNECAPGIHGFLSYEEARDYAL